MSSPGLSPASNPLSTVTAAAQALITATLHRGANWFFLIAGLSVVNVISAVTGSQWTFLGGLGVTQFVALVSMHMGTSAQMVALFLNIWATAFFICMGVFARKGQQWAFVAGMALYAADALVVVYLQVWLMLLFHGYVFYRLYMGYSSSKHLHAFDKQVAGGGMPYMS